MFKHSTRLANILMMMAALALCVSACSGPVVGLGNSETNVAGLTTPVTTSLLP